MGLSAINLADTGNIQLAIPGRGSQAGLRATKDGVGKLGVLSKSFAAKQAPAECPTTALGQMCRVSSNSRNDFVMPAKLAFALLGILLNA